MRSQEYNLVQNIIMSCCMSINYLINLLRKHIYISNNIAIRIFFYILLIFSLFVLPFMHRTKIILYQKIRYYRKSESVRIKNFTVNLQISFFCDLSQWLIQILIFSSLILSFLPTWEDKYGKKNEIMIEL